MTDLILTTRRTIEAGPEQIYTAWLDPVVIAKYMTIGPDMQARHVRNDPASSRIAFTWETPWSAPGSMVDLPLTPVTEGTEVMLTHLKFPSGQSRDGHLKGWTGILERLGGLVA